VPDPSCELIVDIGSTGSLRHDIEGLLTKRRAVHRDVVSGLSREPSVIAASGAILVGPRLNDGSPAIERIAALRNRVPHVGIFVVVRDMSELARWLPAMAWAGVDESFALDVAGDRAALVESVGRRLQAPPPEVAMRKLWAHWESLRVRAIAMHVVRNAFREFDATRRLRWFRIGERTLRSRLNEGPLPAVSLLERFGCVLHGRGMTDAGVRPTGEVARRLGMETASEYWGVRRRVRKALAPWPDLATLVD